ncbi:MAG: hypothetical protein KBF71_09000, partial [Alphaproteobacteria bacterium]|nr:hypothetical protein [Alphaproteobacteria bacterium]
MHAKSKGSWGRKSKQDSEHHSDRVNRNSYESETGSVSFVSKNDATMVAPKVRAAEDFELVSTEGIASLK